MIVGHLSFRDPRTAIVHVSLSLLKSPNGHLIPSFLLKDTATALVKLPTLLTTFALLPKTFTFPLI